MNSENTNQRHLFQGGMLLILLISADVAFILIDLVFHLLPSIKNGAFCVETDRGYPEIFQYVKTFWIILIFAVLLRQTRDYVYIGWIMLYTYILIDDSQKIHEFGGIKLAKYFDFPNALGLRAQDFGELMIFAIVGVLLLLVISITYFRSSKDTKKASNDLFILLAIFGFFGIIIDMLHIIVGNFKGNFIFGTLEDGGEMIVLSFICCYLINLVEQKGIVNNTIWDKLKSIKIYIINGAN